MPDSNYIDLNSALLRMGRSIAAGDVSSGRSGIARSAGAGGAVARGDQPGIDVPDDGDLPYFTFGSTTSGFGNSQLIP